MTPQRQREFFALLLIGIGALLLVLLLSSNAGAVGQFVSQGVQQAFGSGAAVVPLLLIVVGGLLIWQERIVDAPVSGSNVAGILLLAVVVLAMLEPKDLDEFVPLGTGGGMVGRGVDYLLVSAFGAAGTWTVLWLVLVFAILLTFNVTLRQFFEAIQSLVTGLWHLVVGVRVVGGPERDTLTIEPVPFSSELKQPRKPAREPEALPKPATAEELQKQLVLTPIAERPTQPGLFDRSTSVTTAKGGEQPAKPAKHDPAAVSQVLDAIDASIPPRQIWPTPTLSLLDTYVPGQVDEYEKRSKARVIEDTLSSFRIEAQVVGMNPGPAVTQYQLQPAVGVKVSKITSLERDLALALAAPSIRIEAPIPGTSYIGIEIPNVAISSVSLKEVVDTPEYKAHTGKLKLGLGKDVSGTPVVTDLCRAPHLLIAGSTGTGKSVAINAIIATLLLHHTPDELKLIMIDPKMVEMLVYNQVPHLLAPVVTELERVVSLLKWAVREMERRYKLLAAKGFRNIDSYNKEARRRAELEPLPYIVIVVDELADLMLMAPDEVETLICRLAQMARAIGIHLILATQRPSVDVVTGLIKANFPTRMAFAVSQQIDSRVILDINGAEQLLGRGDMLYLASDAPKPIRVQGTNVSEREIERIVSFWRAAQKSEQIATLSVPLRAAGAENKPAVPAVSALSTEAVSALPAASVGTLSANEQDELLPQAIKLVRQHERASASLLQRRMRIGYSKAAQLIDLLEQRGIVGPAEGSRSREVLADDETLASPDI